MVGGGYIGLENGLRLRRPRQQGHRRRDDRHLLPGVDPDLVRPLAARLQKRFRRIFLILKVTKAEEIKRQGRKGGQGGQGDKESSSISLSPCLLVSLSGTAGDNLSEPEAVFDKVLVAVGRRPNSANLGLDKAGVAVE